MIFDDRACSLGEGPLWHPVRQSLFWFDINKCRMFERRLADDKATVWQFDEHVSAAGWVDAQTLFIASETALFKFDIATGESRYVAGLETDNPTTRSNDGRADPQGGFWIGTMGKQAEPGAGAIYRYYQGELRKLYADITISNSICFAPDGGAAYFCDTPTKRIRKQRLDGNGWPDGEAEIFVDVAPYNPDGSVVDGQGNLWNAQWGGHRVACYDRNGAFVKALKFDAAQISCPAFGGQDLDMLFATSARENLDQPQSFDGVTFYQKAVAKGQQEHRVQL